MRYSSERYHIITTIYVFCSMYLKNAVSKTDLIYPHQLNEFDIIITNNADDIAVEIERKKKLKLINFKRIFIRISRITQASQLLG